MRLKELLSYNDIVIQCHDFPDADTVGAGYALYKYLTDNGKAPRLVYGGKMEITKPNLLLMVERLGIPLEYVQSIKPPELLVTVDCLYTEKNVTHFPAKNYAAIDHHSVEELPESMTELRDSYGSCSTVMAKMLAEEGIDYNSDLNIATALYYGLYMDTGEFSEVKHPADKDLRDFAKYDNVIIQLLKNTNLSLHELNIAGDALNSVRLNSRYHFATAEAKPCDPNILGFISDLVLQVEGIDVCIIYSRLNQHGIKISVRSCINELRANEVAKAVTEGVGNGGGHHQKAGGFINGDRLSEDIDSFIESRVIDAYNKYEILSCDSLDLSRFDLKKYAKKPQLVGYTLSTDILPEGSKIRIRTLEGDLDIATSADTYIMITKPGSIYPLTETSS